MNRERHEERERRAGRRLLPGELLVHPGVVRRAGRKWVARIAVGDADWRRGAQAEAEASNPAAALRRAFDAALLELLQGPPPPGEAP